MPTVFLGPRLQKVASYVPREASLGDIGTDHAYLPIYLYEQAIIAKAVAVDVHKGPYLSACKAVAERGLEQAIEVRFGDGLKPVKPGEVDALTIAGMGGSTMLEILAARPEVLAQVHTLVLQPQGAEARVRQNMLAQGWFLTDEELVEEEDRIYVVMLFARNKGIKLEEVETKIQQWQQRVEYSLGKFLMDKNIETKSFMDKEISRRKVAKFIWDFGPIVIDKGGELLQRMLINHAQQIDIQISQMQLSQRPEVNVRIADLQTERMVGEEIKACLFQ